MTTAFVPGIELARSFHDDVVGPILADELPGVPYSAALLGEGSEVLGFDTARSTDHDWCPRVQVFLDRPTARQHARRLVDVFAKRLPATWRGHPTAVVHSQERDLPPRHRIVVTDVGSWATALLGFDPRAGIAQADWLSTPTQRLAEFTGGAVFHDGLVELASARAALAWYPDDLWRHVLACQWRRIAQEEAFPGRCAEVGDELGSAVVTARLVRDLMRLCLLMRRRYPPYGKWLGTAFARLPDQGDLPARLRDALSATDWPTRERHLTAAYENVAARHNELGLTEPLPTNTRPYFGRPFQVIEADRFVRALGVTGPLTGAVDQFVDSTDALGDHHLLRRIIT